MESHARPFLDDQQAAAALAQAVPGFGDGTWQILSARVAQSRRRISRRLLQDGGLWLGAVWQLQVRDLATGRCGEQWLYGRFYRGHEPAAQWQQEADRACAMPRFGRPVELLPEAGLVLWALPNDPVMSELGAFLDPAALAVHLPPALAPDAGTAVSATVVRHEPEEHCTARFRCLHKGQALAFYGKCYAGERWRDARDGLDALWHQSENDPQAFFVGRPLGASPRLGAVWQAEVEGAPLATELTLPEGRRLITRLAEALWRFQQAGPRQGPVLTQADAVETAAKWRKKLVLAEPALSDAADPVVSLLHRVPLRSSPEVPVHGDFHVDQMLWTGHRIALFDYDNLAMGSPVRDLADCISQLLCREDAGDWQTLSSQLLADFRAASGKGFDDEDFEWHLRLMLLRKAYSFMVRNRAGWRRRCERALLLALAGMNALPPALRGGAS